VKTTRTAHERPSAELTSREIPLGNRYQVLTDTRNDNTTTGTADPKVAKPPPIFVYGVINLPEMRRINDLLDEGQYTIKSMANNTNSILCVIHRRN
jgi:hypothetical protein